MFVLNYSRANQGIAGGFGTPFRSVRGEIWLEVLQIIINQFVLRQSISDRRHRKADDFATSTGGCVRLDRSPSRRSHGLLQDVQVTCTYPCVILHEFEVFGALVCPTSTSFITRSLLFSFRKGPVNYWRVCLRAISGLWRHSHAMIEGITTQIEDDDENEALTERLKPRARPISGGTDSDPDESDEESNEDSDDESDEESVESSESESESGDDDAQQTTSSSTNTTTSLLPDATRQLLLELVDIDTIEAAFHAVLVSLSTFEHLWEDVHARGFKPLDPRLHRQQRMLWVARRSLRAGYDSMVSHAEPGLLAVVYRLVMLVANTRRLCAYQMVSEFGECD